MASGVSAPTDIQNAADASGRLFFVQQNGIVRLFSNGQQAIVVQNTDFTLATAARPLIRSEFALVYAAGLGRLSNQPPTGSAAPASPPATALADVRATIAGVPCEVPFAGLAPGLAGVYQVDFRVPPNAPAGSQDFVLTANGVATTPVQVFVQ